MKSEVRKPQVASGNLQLANIAKLRALCVSALKQKSISILLCLLIALGSATAQDSLKDKLDLSGYVKLLGTFNHFNKDYLPAPAQDLVPGSFEDYLIHNRFDLKYYPTPKLSFALGMRNRLFYGYRVREDATFYSSLDEDMGFLDLSYLYWESDQLLLHTIFDRAYAQWETKKWNIRLGRQRINWGVNTVWNPNDIFNQYNYLDFDYEERPGSDALRVQFFPNFNNTLELAFSPARDLEQSVGALLYKTNKWNYDFQLLAGYYKQDAVAGIGWAGNIWNAGFKGEANYYAPLSGETLSNFTTSLSVDYMFGNGLYTQLSYLYNGLGTTDPNFTDFSALNTRLMDAKDIFIYKHTLLVSGSFNITPLFTANLATMFTPDLKNFILFPTLTYSLEKNLDASLVVQYFISENSLQNDQVEWLSGAIFGRLKYSF